LFSLEASPKNNLIRCAFCYTPSSKSAAEIQKSADSTNRIGDVMKNVLLVTMLVLSGSLALAEGFEGMSPTTPVPVVSLGKGCPINAFCSDAGAVVAVCSGNTVAQTIVKNGVATAICFAPTGNFFWPSEGGQN
jgi:hypothetical protein